MREGAVEGAVVEGAAVEEAAARGGTDGCVGGALLPGLLQMVSTEGLLRMVSAAGLLYTVSAPGLRG